MTIKVTGKNVDAGESFKSYIEDKLSTVLGKYIGPDITGHVRLEKERSTFRTNCSLNLRSGLTMEAAGEGPDAYVSADNAVHHLETRVRRHKRRLKSHHHNGRDHHPLSAAFPAKDFTVSLESEEHDAPVQNESPLIVAETQRDIREMPVSEAVMQLDVSEAPFLLFKNAGHGTLNIVYRRDDGNIGWIDPNSIT